MVVHARRLTDRARKATNSLRNSSIRSSDKMITVTNVAIDIQVDHAQPSVLNVTSATTMVTLPRCVQQPSKAKSSLECMKS